MIYFDNAATTPLHPEVKVAMTEAMELFGNPTSIHAFGRRSRVFIEDQRTLVASLLGADPSEIVFTSGGTESIQTALTGAVDALGIRRIITTPLEHHAVIHNLAALQERYPLKVEHVAFDDKGCVDTGHLEELLQAGGDTLVALMHANNETGMLLPLEQVAALCGKHGALFHCDTVQSIGKYRLTFDAGVTFASASAHKFHGPKGVGFLYLRSGTTIPPLILGGGQERNMRSGTENITGIAGLGKALEVALRDAEEVQRHIGGLRQAMLTGLLEMAPEVLPLTVPDNALHTILNVGFPADLFGGMLLYRLDIAGVAASGGSACASGVNNPSHVLKALGVSGSREHIRFSFSRFNTMEEVRECLAILRTILKKKKG